MAEDESIEVIYALGFNMPFFDRVIMEWMLEGGRDKKEESVGEMSCLEQEVLLVLRSSTGVVAEDVDEGQRTNNGREVSGKV